jgi:RNA polymerase sigma-32 factor
MPEKCRLHQRPIESAGDFRCDPSVPHRPTALFGSASEPDRTRNSQMKAKSDPTLAWLIAGAQRYPLLSREREQEVCIAWRDNADRAALEQLVGSHLRLVIKIARRYGGYGLPVADLVSEGSVGLLQAAKRFDPGRGCRFSTYAILGIRSSIQEYILRSWSLVRIGTTTSQKKLFFNLRRLKARLCAFELGDMTPENVAAIATELDVRQDDVVEMNQRLCGADCSLHAAMDSDLAGEWLDTVPDANPTQEALVIDLEDARRQRSLVRGALTKLSLREREILVDRYLTDRPATLVQLSHRYAVSGERIRQIENRAVEKLQKAIKTEALAENRKMENRPKSNPAAPAEKRRMPLHSDPASVVRV